MKPVRKQHSLLNPKECKLTQDPISAAGAFAALRQAYFDGTSSPRDLLESYLNRISSIEGQIRAFVTIAADSARKVADESAKRYRAGRALSLIDGLPIGLKDNLETRDMPTSFGSPIFSNWNGGRDSAVAYGLRRSGAVIVGKLSTTEFAGTVVTSDTRNPCDLSRTPGGSSSGPAAAVAAGMLPVALGSQVVGSIIRPASFCGVYGFKPTYGSLNRAATGDIYSQNCIGTLSSSLDLSYLVCHEIAKIVGGDPGHLPFQGGAAPEVPVRPRALAVLETAGWESAAPAAKEEFSRVLVRLSEAGVRIMTRETSALVSEVEDLIVDARSLAGGICAYEAIWPYAEVGELHPDKFSEQMKDRLALGARISAEEYSGMLLRRDRMSRAYSALITEIDACITLSASGTAPVGLGYSGDPVFSVPFTTMRVPAISLPILAVDGLPLGLQVAGFAHQERKLSSVASWILEAAADC